MKKKTVAVTIKEQNKRNSNKNKLSALEWTDEAIQEYSDLSSLPPATKNAENGGDPLIDTMESKIARVQQRKKEEAERKLQRAKLPAKPAKPTAVLAKYSIENKVSSPEKFFDNELSDSLNNYFAEYFGQNPLLVSEFEAHFPLEYYDNSSFDELLPISKTFPVSGCCLLTHDGSLIERAVGNWVPCRVLDQLADGQYQVEVASLLHDDVHYLQRMHLCLNSHSPEVYGDRITDAILRRHEAVSLLRHKAYIQGMPFNELVSSTMTQEQFDSIFVRAASTKKLFSLPSQYAHNNIEEAKNEYEIVMNQLLFDSNTLCVSNKAFNSVINIPTSAYSRKKHVPRSGLVEIPSYQLSSSLNYHKSNSYLSSTAAVRALQGLLLENRHIQDAHILKIEYTKTFTLDKFERFLSEQMMYAVRIIRQDWPQKSGNSVRNAIMAAQEHLPENYPGVTYDIGIRNVYDFEKSKNQIKSFLERINFMMSDVLKDIIKNSLYYFAKNVEELCSSEVIVQDVRNILVKYSANSIYKRKVLPPLFSVSFRITTEDKVLNTEEMETNKQDIAKWMKTKEAEAGEKCPIAVIKPIVGKTFEYSHSVEEFKQVFLRAYAQVVNEFTDVPHLQKYVMEKIYFPNPKVIPSVSLELDWVKSISVSIDKSLSKALAPLTDYLKFFKKFENFVNINNDEYINSVIKINHKDPDSAEIEIPVTVNLQQLMSVLDSHYAQIKEVEESLPVTPIDCGLILVEVVSVRQLLLDKHRAIIKSILTAHADRTVAAGVYLDEVFKKINKSLSKRPENIEELVELEEYVAGLGNTLMALQNCIQEMMSYGDILDKYRHKKDFDLGVNMWAVYGSPAKVQAKCAEVQESNIAIKRRFRDDMLGEQVSFSSTLKELSEEVKALQEFTDINDVTNIAERVKEVETKLNAAQASARLFNSRESLFEQDITDYEDLNRIVKNFEPFLNLWQTTKDWTEKSQIWNSGRFVDLVAEEVEQAMDKFNIAINKAAKYFAKADMQKQSDIAANIKTQINAFMPEVPMIVVLRNPGMRDRHWEKISAQLNVTLTPIEDFTTDHIIAMNLKDSLDLIQKIGESAAKEYQIEGALDKMEREWEDMHLQIHPYRETGTGVLKGVDDINTILDEQITMTQVNLYLATT